MEKEIYDNLTMKLNSKNISDEEWLQIYKKIEKFNYDIKKRYTLIERELERVRQAKTVRELDDIAYTTNTILNDTNTICKRHETELFSYSNKAEQMMSPMQAPREQMMSPMQVPREQMMSPRQMPAEQMMSPRQMNENLPSGLTSQRIPDMSRSYVRSPSPVMSRTQIRSPSPVRVSNYPNQNLPSGLTSQRIPEMNRSYVRSPSPVMSRTQIRSPTMGRTEIRSPSPAPKSILKKKTVTFAEPEIHEHIHKVPITQRSIIQPEVVKHEIYQSQPLLQPVEVKQKKELPVIPVEKFPEPRKQSVRYDKSVKITGEKINKTSDGTYVKTPKRVETTRTIPKEYMGDFHSNLHPKEKIIRIEPVYGRKMKEKSIPVRAICDYTPQGPGEIGLQEGQATLYLGTNQNGWSRVRHANQAEGYVPHSYLSK